MTARNAPVAGRVTSATIARSRRSNTLGTGTAADGPMMRQSSNQFAGVLKSSRFGKCSPTPALIPNGVPGSGLQLDAPSQKSCAERCAVARARATTVATRKPDDGHR